MTDDVESLKARLRQIDDYQRKGLMRTEEAEAARQALLHRLMHLVVPDNPLPRVAWRVHLGSVLAMLVVVGGVAAYLLSGHAGLRRQSEEMLAEGRIAAAQDEAARRERLERQRAGLPTAPDRFGRFAGTASGAAAVAPLLSGHIALAPALRSRVADDDAVFIVVRLPDDLDGLPLAAVRTGASNLPFDFVIGRQELLGAPDRLLHADKVIVTARVSRSGSGLARPGDLLGSSAPVSPWSANVAVLMDRIVPAK